MTITDLIDLLDSIKAQHGNRDVFVGHSSGIGEVKYLDYHEGDGVVISSD